jgi:hypothetical protein
VAQQKKYLLLMPGKLLQDKKENTKAICDSLPDKTSL